MLKRFLVGTAVGGALVYLFDSEKGPERRQKLMSFWEENREPVVRAGQNVKQTVQDVTPKVKNEVSKRVDGSGSAEQSVRTEEFGRTTG